MKRTSSWDGPDIHVPAKLLADPVRVTMLLMLNNGDHTASELASAANVAPSTASFHLAQLTDAGWITVQAYGKYRRYALACSDPLELINVFGAFDRRR